MVKSACLAGDSIEFGLNADGSLSIKNLAGKGELKVVRKKIVTVDVPDSSKQTEFNEIRKCIKNYLKPEAPPAIPNADSGWVDGGSNPSAFCNPELEAAQAKYPDFNVKMRILPEQHRSEHNPFKHDLYRYTCSFAASPKQ